MTARYQAEGVDRVWYTVGASKSCRPNQHRKSSHMAKFAGTHAERSITFREGR